MAYVLLKTYKIIINPYKNKIQAQPERTHVRSGQPYLLNSFLSYGTV